MPTALVRQWHLLMLIPKGPRRADTTELVDQLRARGVDVHRRTVQRDLVELARVFPIVSDLGTKPYGWRWRDDAELLCTIPALPGVRRSLPRIDLALRVHRDAARAIAEGLRGSGATANDVVTVPRGPLVELRSRVADGCGLRRWIFGFGDAVEVLGPPELVAEIGEKAARIAAVYARGR